MWPFSKITHWPYKDWDDWSCLSANERKRRIALRTQATELAKRDLQKPVQHLLRDVHEEILHPWPYQTDEIAKQHDDGIGGPFPEMNWTESRHIAQLGRVIGAQKAIAALLAITAWEAKRTACILICLTCVLVVLTVGLVWPELIPHPFLRKDAKISTYQKAPPENIPAAPPKPQPTQEEKNPE